MSALQKPNGGVRGIVAGDIVRRLVARTIAQQLSTEVERATTPFQYALTTKAGGECIAHAFQALTDLDERATVLSIDGIGAFDLISRGAMLDGLRSVPGGNAALPFVLQFHGSPSSYLWDDDEGEMHEIKQGEGGEQGDALMPLLYALGQHQALQEVQSQLCSSERLFAFLDDIYVVSAPERTCEVYNILRRQHRKTQIWNRAGVVPRGHDALLRLAQLDDPEAQIWFGDLSVPPEERGIRVLGTPLGTDAFIQLHLQGIVDSHQLLLNRIPVVSDLQSCCCFALRLVQTTTSECVTLIPRRTSPVNMTFMCGIACAS